MLCFQQAGPPSHTLDRVEPDHRVAKTLSSGDCSAIQRANRTQARVEADDARVACSSAAKVLSQLMQYTRTLCCRSTCSKCNHVRSNAGEIYPGREQCTQHVHESGTSSQGCPATSTTSIALGMLVTCVGWERQQIYRPRPWQCTGKVLACWCTCLLCNQRA